MDVVNSPTTRTYDRIHSLLRDAKLDLDKVLEGKGEASNWEYRSLRFALLNVQEAMQLLVDSKV